MARYLIFTIPVLLFIAGCGSSRKTAKVNVVPDKPAERLITVSTSDMQELINDGSRPILVFFYTDWCKYCENMKRTTFRDPQVISYLNDNFYYVPFNAEQKDKLSVAGTEFSYKARGGGNGTHEFAEIMATTDGELKYPTIVIFNKDLEIMFKYNSFLSALELLPILRDFY
mgnify:CR=1 FL=1